MNSNSNERRNNRLNLGFGVAFIVFVISYWIWHEIDERSALKNSSLVNAKLIRYIPSRGNRILEVEYNFNGKLIENQISVRVDTFKVGEALLLEVSNEHPDEYAVIVGKIKR
ncbi:hypothetical protein BEL04_20195 [Mucilaginibacter sp. PPCGB 2223]|uniref:hypothetical protein n=1 Tax=Mucilaginibacter sp. PPCGB 2223 TaxID=1886027 RepID=UPI0008260B78|nr:hypothetical protein [Mucilaginibacter sp. PPCGB 2223]OCX51040.1 hypothetical protein BEL04_20195 [Mucilaginibacter sp. PPCGB 2223]